MSVAKSLQDAFESVNVPGALVSIFILRACVANHERNLELAVQCIGQAMENDRDFNGSRYLLTNLNIKASFEGYSENLEGAKMIVEEATGVELRADMPQFSDYVMVIRGKAYYEARNSNFDKARAIISRAITLTAEGWLENSWNLLVAAYIELFSGDSTSAKATLEGLINDHNFDDKTLLGKLHRALGEIAIVEHDVDQARVHFTAAKSVCENAGMSPRFLYAMSMHWYSMPVEYDGWSRFLDDKL